MIYLNDIRKTYYDGNVAFEALRGIDLTINQGEMVAIMGPSGSGKSTLLNIIGCIENPTEGIYNINGQDVFNMSEKRIAGLRNSLLGFVLQDFALIERYTVKKNVLMPLNYRKRNEKLSKKGKNNLLDDMLKKLGIFDKKNTLVRHLSGGQRQRVAIARALINNAQIILCDEPTGALDQKTGKEIMKVFKQLNEIGKTIVIVTHDPQVAAACDKTINIEDGKIVS